MTLFPSKNKGKRWALDSVLHQRQVSVLLRNFKNLLKPFTKYYGIVNIFNGRVKSKILKSLANYTYLIVSVIRSSPSSTILGIKEE